MTTERAARVLLVLALAASAAVSGTAARAQERSASLTLLAQTPWSSAFEDPELSISLLATNTGTEVLEDLQVVLTIGPFYASRLQYEASLSEGPPYSVHDETFRFKGDIGPGQARTLTIALDLSETPGISQIESLVYPSRVSLLSEGEAVGRIDTPILYFFQPPEAPMLSSAWIELEAPVAFGPDGLLADPAFEASLDAGGSLWAPVSALAALQEGSKSPPPVDVVIEPSLVEQANRMSRGYSRVDGSSVAEGEGAAAAAGRFLAQLSETLSGPGVATHALPFSGPAIPAMLGAGLGADLGEQQDFGESQLDSIGVTLDPSVARPPGGFLSDDSIGWLAGGGATTILADADEVERPVQEGGYAPPPTATVAGLTLVLPDPGTQGLLARPDLLADPVRASQVVLGELAVIWKERPVPPDPEVRGIALRLPSSLPPGMWEPLLLRLTGAPFLRTVHAQDLAGGVNPAGAPAVLPNTPEPAYSAGYATRLRELRDDLAAYSSMLAADDGGISERLEVGLLYAQAGEFTGNEAGGDVWLDSIGSATFQAFRGTTPQIEQIFTFTSREGTIPLRMGDPGPTPLRVTIALQSTQFDFPAGDRQKVTLDRPGQIVTFEVVAKAAGRNPILVLVLSPSGQVISQQTLIVQTTTLNRIALIVTAAAAGVLVLLHSRRWFRRRNRSS
jgi:hypothetical protein